MPQLSTVRRRAGSRMPNSAIPRGGFRSRRSVKTRRNRSVRPQSQSSPTRPRLPHTRPIREKGSSNGWRFCTATVGLEDCGRFLVRRRQSAPGNECLKGRVSHPVMLCPGRLAADDERAAAGVAAWPANPAPTWRPCSLAEDVSPEGPAVAGPGCHRDAAPPCSHSLSSSN